MASVNWYTNQKRTVDNIPSYTQYVLKDEPTSIEALLFSDEKIKDMSKMITDSLKGVDSQGRDIVVGDNVIKSVLDSVIQSYTPLTGDIYSKYQVMYNQPRNDLQDVVFQVVEIITSQIRTETEMIQNNQKLNIWDTLLGDFNDKGLLAHPPIKLKNKRPDPMLFHMKY